MSEIQRTDSYEARMRDAVRACQAKGLSNITMPAYDALVDVDKDGDYDENVPLPTGPGTEPGIVRIVIDHNGREALTITEHDVAKWDDDTEKLTARLIALCEALA